MKTILVIDDNLELRENTAEILELAGYRAVTAENGKKGVELALEHKPDLIVCDIMMPDLDGYGVLHLLKKNAETENIPFIFLTAKTERSDFRKGMEMGADDYITKPFDDLELLKAIEIRLKKAEILQHSYPAGTRGANELIKELGESGFFPLNHDEYGPEQYLKKSLIYSEGKRPRYVYYIEKGKVKTFRQHDDGKEYITNMYVEGDYFGYIPVIEDTLYEDTAVTQEDSEIIAIEKDKFLNALFNDQQLTRKFIRLIANNVKEKEERLLHMAYDSLRKRVALALVNIYTKFYQDQSNGEILDIPREDIAQFVGTATESLIRTLSDFKSEGLIEIQHAKIRITDIDRLRNLLY
jgi:CheY-like chemotaxis protein